MSFLSKLFGSPTRVELSEDTSILAGKSIFAVDASVTIQMVLKLTFAPYNCKLTLSGTGQEALSCLGQARPDIVLLGMPLQDIPWRDMARMIKERCPETPVILLKSTFAKCPKEEAEKIGIYKIIEKPFDSNMLVNEVAGVVRKIKGENR